MKKFLLFILPFLFISLNGTAQCTITGTSPNSGSYTCASFSGCTVIYVGDGINPTNLVMSANFDLTCMGAIQFIIRNNANIDFSNNNYNLNLAANSSITIEPGGNLSTSPSCSASDLIYIGAIKVASCNGSSAENSFPELVSEGGYNTVSVSSTVICGSSGTSTITATMNPAPSAATIYKWYTVATGGTAFLTSNANSSPYTATYTTGTLSANTTYYIEATTGSIVTPRRAVQVILVPTTAPTVSLTQPTCSVSTGTITITSPIGTGYTYSTNGSTYTNTTGIFTTVAAGTYNVTARYLGCTTSATSATLNAQSTPVKPTTGSLVQPTCAVPNASFTITNYNASYTYAASPSTGVSFSGSTVTAPSGATYTITATLGSCTSTASNNIVVNALVTNTWNSGVWSLGSNPTNTQRIIFNQSYTSSSDLNGCSCQVNSGAAVTISTGNSLNITNAVTVISGGSLTFEDTASLVQTNNASSNSGNITYKRKTTPLKQYDYTYWSSPVASATLSQLATNSLFYSFNPSINNWVYQTGSYGMTPGVGYIGRAPGNLTYAPTQIVETSFVGVPNNGTINTSIIKSAAGGYNLIGNPYPSAIDVDVFITANTASTNGTVYFWTHNTAITNFVYTINDYAKYNLTGAVRTSTSAPTGGALPTGKIGAGQGFFIEAKTSLGNGTYSATFNNAARVSGNNTLFFKNGEPSSTTNSISEGLERHRIWLSLSNSQGAYNQMLVGYVEGATNDFDSLFDGKTLPVNNPVAIYTEVGADDLSIQGKSLPFSENDIVPVNYSTTLNGELTISLDNFDGLFDDQEIYLLDKYSGIFHDLKANNVSFTSTAGTFNDRFELHYTTQSLGNTNPVAIDKDIKIIVNNQELTVLCASASITKVEVYDILGKLLFTQSNLNTHELKTQELNISSQMILVKVSTDNGQTYTKKTLIH